ncbi:MAG TPA: cyclopropane-fatty-acyl-phospholipid synthase family protein [Drouetiella sp.]
MHFLYKILELDVVPDSIIRMGIRNMLAQKLEEEKAVAISAKGNQNRLSKFASELKTMPLALSTERANEQHYEVPTDFYKLVLGPRMKYSSAFWNDDTQNLQKAEEVMLALSCERAELQDGMEILELGCGWGSLSLWMAEHYPNSKILAVSNSRTQKEFIEASSAKRSLTNLEVQTCDINNFKVENKFDRVVSIEMFEHLKNYELLFRKISSWLKPDGKLFVHIFSHKEYAYHYENRDGNDWLTEYFFTGGTMPSDKLFALFNDDLQIEKQWQVNGMHYQKTVAAWIENFEKNKASIKPIFATAYGADEVRRWWVYWKLFFFACEELFRYRDGNEWIVSHYLFEQRAISHR